MILYFCGTLYEYFYYWKYNKIYIDLKQIDTRYAGISPIYIYENENENEGV